MHKNNPQGGLMKKIFAIFAMVIGMSSLAHAGILVEPYLGYQSGTAKYTYDSSIPVIGGQSSTDTMTGTAYGLRLGYKFLLPWVALDYTGGSGKTKMDLLDTTSDYTSSSLGITAGVDLPIIHPYAGYGFNHQVTVKGTASTNEMKLKGTYLKAGVGLGFIPFVDIKLEYQINNFTKVDTGSGEQDKSALFSDLSSNTFMIGVSLPLNL
jgi:opacity protein-like surface antigen